MEAIIPIHKKWLDKIISGEKTVELRKGHYQYHIDRLYLYETAPISAVVGYVDIDHNFVFSKRYFEWVLCGGGCSSKKTGPNIIKESAVPNEELGIWLRNTRNLTAFEITKVVLFDEPLKPRAVPQSLKYVQSNPFAGW